MECESVWDYVLKESALPRSLSGLSFRMRWKLRWAGVRAAL